MLFKCNGEVLEVSYDDGKTWAYVTDCCESLEETFVNIAYALRVHDYDFIEED